MRDTDALPLRDHRSYAARFADALLDPGRPTPASVAGPNGKAAVRRYNVYRNNVTVSLIDALAAVYPAVLRITGPDVFRAMARVYVRAHPPASPLLFDYGRDFPDCIAGYHHARPLPWLADVARIERAWLDAYHAADAEPLTPASLASVPAERLIDVRFTPHPATRILRSPYPAVSLFAAHRADAFSGDRDGSGHDKPEDALLTRPRLEVMVRHLPPGGAVFLQNLLAGEPLGVAAAAALAASVDFDLAANIAGMLEAGALTSLRVGGS